ncbi:Uncharacterized Nudix hydrolase NudL [hydrothermal vent metagenome]|uniref:Uncharacterized Nudix hydrolase NudL n=1 Tax=hydrothermal vent metagenome TaxID=652676 RepID=A0A3B0RKB3_9ZZZZ
MKLDNALPAYLRAALQPSTTEAIYSDYDLNNDRAGVLPDGKPAAVLVPLILRKTGWQVLLTLRSEQMPFHAGQISFPGGRCAADDADMQATSLREFEEETGVPQQQVKILGQFEQYHTVTNFRITPFVGVIAPPVRLSPDPREVAEIFEVPFSFVSNLSNFKRQSALWQGQQRFYYSIPWQNRYIWGATAGLLRTLAKRMQASSNGNLR